VEVSGEDAQDPGEQEEDLLYLKARSSVGDPDLDPQDRRIRMFFGLPDRDPLVRGMDLDPALDPGGFPFSFKGVEWIEIMLAK
jgi:hypothetical protein